MRVPGTINSKCAQEIKIVQLWDGQRPAINYLLRDFTRWLINEKLMQRLVGSRKAKPTNSTTISRIEKLLQTQIDDHRKFVVWRILVPYPILESVPLMKHPILSGDG